MERSYQILLDGFLPSVDPIWLKWWVPGVDVVIYLRFSTDLIVLVVEQEETEEQQLQLDSMQPLP